MQVGNLWKGLKKKQLKTADGQLNLSKKDTLILNDYRPYSVQTTPAILIMKTFFTIKYENVFVNFSLA